MPNTFDLRIRFTGLCLLVPDTRTPQRPRLHVLLPHVDGHDHAGHGGAHPGGAGGAGGGAGEPAAAPVVKHFSRLIYDSAYRLGERELQRKLDCVDIHGRLIELTGLGPDEIDPFIPREVADLGKVVTDRTRLHTFLDNEAPGHELAARITVDRGAVSDCLLGTQARFAEPVGAGEPQDEPRLTAQVEWTIRGIEGDSFTIPMQKGLNGAGKGTDVTLFPIGRTISVEIWNAPEHELPGAPPREGEMAPATDHFAAFYSLVDAAEHAVPRASSLQFKVQSACVSPEKRLETGRPIAPGTLMCMTGQVRA